MPIETIPQIKAAYRKAGGQARISSQQQRCIERSCELDRRAEAIREKEKRRKAAKKKRAEKEQREQKARDEAGIGLATQCIGYSRSQAKMRVGMETWVAAGAAGKRDDNDNDNESDVNSIHDPPVDALSPPSEEEPAAEPVVEEPRSEPRQELRLTLEPWDEEQLDEDALLEATVLKSQEAKHQAKPGKNQPIFCPPASAIDVQAPSANDHAKQAGNEHTEAEAKEPVQAGLDPTLKCPPETHPVFVKPVNSGASLASLEEFIGSHSQIARELASSDARKPKVLHEELVAPSFRLSTQDLDIFEDDDKLLFTPVVKRKSQPTQSTSRASNPLSLAAEELEAFVDSLSDDECGY